MGRGGRWTAFLVVGACAAAGCGDDDVIAVGASDSAVAGDRTSAHPDSGQGGTGQTASGGMGGATASPDSSADVASDGAVARPDVDGSADSAGDAASEPSSDVSSETLAVDGTSDDAIADADDDGPPISKICASGCVITDDCRPGTSIYKPICEPATHRCVSCIDDLPCIAGASVWSKSCTVDGDCGPIFGDYCVDIGGAGFCAFDSTKSGTLSCVGNASSYTVMKHDGSSTVSVCARLTTTCDLRRGQCQGPCTITCAADGGACTNTCTVSRGGKICNATTRRCECASDNDCASPTSHCNPITLQCECTSGNDCSPDGGSTLVCK